ncbi:MAG: class I SAM-dependent methyltransferase [Campylobacterota bacterium]|nr:class I SAM-dependent methyltransferase [Campylobacterota bacterium]
MRCLICDTLCDSFEDAKRGVLYFECSSCHFIMKSKEHFSSFDTQKERYDLHNNSEENEGYQEYFQRFIDFALSDIPKPRSVLDFGCGASSLLAQMISKEGIACDFYDPIYHPNESYKNKTYDLITSVEVFEHLHDPKATLEMLIQSLNPKGYIALQSAFHPHDRERFLSWYYRLDPTHIVFFSPKSFEALAKSLNLSIVASNAKNMVLLQRL